MGGLKSTNEKEGCGEVLCSSCYNYLKPLHSKERQHARGDFLWHRTKPSIATWKTYGYKVPDHCLIRLLPHHPQVWIDRGTTFLALGYGELAAADSYKAHLLYCAASAEQIKAQDPSDGSLTAKVLGTVLSKLPQTEDQSAESHCILVFSNINRMHQQAYIILAQNLSYLNA